MSSIHSSRQTTPPPSQELPLSDRSLSTQALQEGRSVRKQRRNPSITPRKFNRFFTPRSLRSSDATSSPNALMEINGGGYNRGGPPSSPIRSHRLVLGQENTPTTFTRDLKRRKLYHTPDSSPNQPQIEGKEQEIGLRVPHDMDSNGEQENIPSSPCERMQRDLHDVQEEATEESLEHLVEAEERGLGAHLLQLRINAAPTSRRQHLSYPVNGLFLYSVFLSPN